MNRSPSRAPTGSPTRSRTSAERPAAGVNRVFSQGLKLIHRTTGRFLPAGIFARNYPGVPGRIHVDDPMLPVDSPRELRHYVEDAQSAIANIEESLHVVGRTFRDVASCLDLPCGYGRVTRFLCEKVASIHITDNAIIPLKERVVDEFYDPLRRLWRRLRGSA